jgi:hypothetical protein
MKKYEFEFCDISLHISKQNMLIYIYTGVIDYVPYIYSIKKTSTTHGQKHFKKFMQFFYNKINLHLYSHVYFYYHHNILSYNNHLLHVYLISILYFFINCMV